MEKRKGETIMTSNEFYILPVPKDTTKIVGIHDGSRWLRGIVHGSVEVHGGMLMCVVNWADGSRRRITLALEEVRGYQEVE